MGPVLLEKKNENIIQKNINRMTNNDNIAVFFLKKAQCSNCLPRKHYVHFMDRFALQHVYTVNSEILARILFSRITLKDTFATIKIRNLDMIYLHQ